jgi:hypothetical protein
MDRAQLYYLLSSESRGKVTSYDREWVTGAYRRVLTWWMCMTSLFGICAIFCASSCAAFQHQGQNLSLYKTVIARITQKGDRYV